MDAIDLLAKQFERLQEICEETRTNTSVLGERFDEFDRKLFGNGQPGEIDKHKTELAGVMSKINKLENDKAERKGASGAWGAMAGGLMWAIGMAMNYLWTRLKMGH